MEELIEKSDAIKAYNDAMNELVEGQMKDLDLSHFSECRFDTTECQLIARKIEDVPIVQSEPKQGVWIADKECYTLQGLSHIIFKCSECGLQQTYRSKYCPDCGAKMRKETE